MTNIDQLNNNITPKGIGTLLDPAEDLLWKPDYDVNSWFAIGHFDDGEQVLSYLVHLMLVPGPDGRKLAQGVVSITNETTGWYRGDDIIVPVGAEQISDAGFDIKLPNSRIHGTLDDLHVEGRLSDGSGSVDLHLVRESLILMNGGTGIFPVIGSQFHQYSVPRLRSRGTITIEGQEHSVEGVSWFDRQWQQPPANVGGDPLAAIKWSWIDVNLDSGDALSVWSAPTALGGEEQAWTTILHQDGSQSVVAVEPGLGAEDYWTSDASGARYPTRWTVRIPAMDAVIDIVPKPRQQEIVSQIPLLHKYEGASEMRGTWRGKPVTGFGYVELVGVWK